MPSSNMCSSLIRREIRFERVANDREIARADELSPFVLDALPPFAALVEFGPTLVREEHARASVARMRGAHDGACLFEERNDFGGRLLGDAQVTRELGRGHVVAADEVARGEAVHDGQWRLVPTRTLRPQAVDHCLRYA